MPRHAHMLDLLRKELVLEEELQNFHAKRELTEEDFDLIIKNCITIRTAAQVARSNKRHQ